MTTNCREFRTLLELVLEGRAAEHALVELSWHEHLVACGECRQLLQAEEALEILLATLPDPKLPAHLARRVVLRLRDARKSESQLDALLELDRAARAPDRLAQSVLARLRPERERSAESALVESEAKLDRWLEFDRDVAVPDGLAGRVLAGLRSERSATRSAHEPVRVGGVLVPQPVFVPQNGASRGTKWMRSPWVYAAAAGILATFVGWSLWQGAEVAPHGDTNNVAENGARGDHGDKTAKRLAPRDPNAAPDADMLAALDVLEHWELLKSDDVDVLLSSSIDPADEALLEFQDMEAANPPLNEKETEPPSKG
jgi:hypothetical protein